MRIPAFDRILLSQQSLCFLEFGVANDSGEIRNNSDLISVSYCFSNVQYISPKAEDSAVYSEACRNCRGISSAYTCMYVSFVFRGM